jgi:hypothetical protein
MKRLDTWTRAARARIARWTCTCGAINPDITGKCIRCGQ